MNEEVPPNTHLRAPSLSSRSEGSRAANRARGADADVALAAALVDGKGEEAAREAWKQLAPLAQRTLSHYPSLGFCHQDLIQEAFMRFFARIGELREPRALRSFLVNICLGVAQNELRRLSHRRIEVPTGANDDARARDSSHEARQAIAQLRQVLARSTEQDRALFIARHVERREVRDIALSLGWTIASTKRRLAQATRRVGRRLHRQPALVDYARAFGSA